MPAPAAPTSLLVDEQAILGVWNGKASNKPGIRFTFTNNALATAQHRLEKSVNAGSSWSLVAISNVGASVIVGGGLALNTAHHFRLRAEDGDPAGPSAWLYLGGGASPGSSHTTPAVPTAGSPPTAPGSVAATVSGSQRVTVTWEDQSTNEVGFLLEFRWGNRTAFTTVASFAESLLVDLADLFNYEYAPLTVANQLMSVCVFAYYGAVRSAASTEVVFQTGAPTIIVTSPASVTAEKGAAFSYTITTNTPATTWTAVSGSFPAGITRTGAVISGTPSAAGSVTAVIDVSNGTTTATLSLTITVRESSIRISSAGRATAFLDTEFSYTILAQRSNGAAAITSYGAANLPAWLTRDEAVLSGTPNEPGEWTVQVSATNGTQTGFGNLLITVGPVGIRSASNIAARIGQKLTFTVLTTPPSAVVTCDDLPAWLTLSGHTITGTPPALGVTEFNLSAEFEGIAAAQTVTVTVTELFDAPTVIVGYVGEVLVESVAYLGEGVITAWQLAGAPSGLAVQELVLWAPYGGARRDSIQGSPAQEGRFEATLSVTVSLPDGSVAISRLAIEFRIQGALYLPWLHPDGSLYDLQVQLRGDAVARELRSYYGVAARPASTSVETVGSVVTTTQNPAVAAHLLTLKRGDRALIAIVIRDGKHSLGATAVSAVSLILRLPNQPDGQWIAKIAGVATAVGAETYFLAELPVTDALITELLGDDGVTAVNVLAEVSWTYLATTPDLDISSATGSVTIAEDVQR